MSEKKKPSKRARRNARVHGFQYLRKNNPDLFIGHLYGYELMGAALRKTAEDGKSTYYQVAYTLKSKNDSFELMVALGNLGLRLEHEDHEFAFKVNTTKPGQIIPDRMARIFLAHLEMDLAAGKRLPNIIEKNYCQGKGRNNYVAPTTRETVDVLEDLVRKYKLEEQYKVRRALHQHTTVSKNKK